MSVKKALKMWVLPPGILLALKRINYCRSFSTSKRGLLRQNKQLKNRHQGRRCFILGAGSSVKSQDITKLKDEVIISVSNTFVHPDFSIIRPKYHALPPILQGHEKCYPRKKFVMWLKEMEARTYDAEMFFHIGDRELIEENGLFKNRIIHWVEYDVWLGSNKTPVDLAKIPSIYSVSELTLTVAIYLGFDKIYLLGLDHDWFNGPLVYFYDAINDHKMQPTEKLLQSQGVDAEFQMRRHAEIFKKYKYLFHKKQNIFNANANDNSYVDTFPKVDFDSLFKSK